MVGFDGWLNRRLRALPFGSRLASLQNRLASFGEQGMQGAANLLVNAILARGLTHQDFATIGVMLGVHYFALGLHRTVIVLPFILDASQKEGEGNGHAGEGRWWWLNLASLAVVAAGLALIAAVAALVTQGSPRDAWFVRGMELAVVVCPCLIFFEFGRRVLYQRRQPATAAIVSAVYLALNLGVAALVSRTMPSPETGILAWVVAGIGAGLIATLAALPGAPALRDGFRAWWAQRGFAWWQGLTNFPYAVYNSSVVVSVGLFGGPIAAAAFTAARTLTNPAVSMVTAVDSLDKPRAARGLASDGIRGLRQSVAGTRRLLAMACGLYLGLLILFAGPALHFAFKNAYADEVNEIRVLAGVFFLICMNQPSETFLIVLRASRLLLVTRIVAAIACVASLAVASRFGLMGVCFALAFTHGLNLINLRVGETIAERRWKREQGTAAHEDEIEAAETEVAPAAAASA